MKTHIMFIRYFRDCINSNAFRDHFFKKSIFVKNEQFNQIFVENEFIVESLFKSIYQKRFKYLLKMKNSQNRSLKMKNSYSC